MQLNFIAPTILVIATVIGNAALAEPTAQQVVERKSDKYNYMFVAGLMSGLSWSNAVAKDKLCSFMFCEPSNLVIQYDQAIDILKRHIERVPKNAKLPAGAVMQFALADTFSCPTQSKNGSSN